MELSKDNTIVLMIDMQERLLPAMRKEKELLNNSIKFVKGLVAIGTPVFTTQQYSRGLGDTVSELKSLIPDFSYFEKKAFGATRVKEVVDAIQKPNKENILVFGIESHVCVLQSCIGLTNLGLNTFAIVDCMSSRKKLDHQMALERLKKEGVRLSTSESVLFELLKTADHENFKAISSIIK